MGKEALAESVRSGESPFPKGTGGIFLQLHSLGAVPAPNPTPPRLPQPGSPTGSPVSPCVPRHSLYLAVTPGSCPAGRCSLPCLETPAPGRGFRPPLQGDTWRVTPGLPAAGALRGHLPLSQALAHFPASPASTVCCCSLPCHSGRVIPL